MWLFDEDKKLSIEDTVKFAKEGSSDAVRNFSQLTLNDSDNMLALIKNGMGSLALTYCSYELKSDLVFLKKAALEYHYINQDEFFNKINYNLKNDKELLEIFAAKVDEPQIKQISNEKHQLDKLLNSEMTGTIKINRHRI